MMILEPECKRSLILVAGCTGRWKKKDIALVAEHWTLWIVGEVATGTTTPVARRGSQRRGYPVERFIFNPG